MRGSKHHKDLKRKYAKLNQEIYLLLYQLDPIGIGITVENPHLDEYESMRIIPKLVKAQSVSEIREIVKEVFDFEFGTGSLTGERLDQVAEEIWKVYQKSEFAGMDGNQHNSY